MNFLPLTTQSQLLKTPKEETLNTGKGDKLKRLWAYQKTSTW